MKINIPIYDDVLYIELYDNHETINKKYKLDTTESTQAVVFRHKKGLIACFKKDQLTRRVLVHECVHIVNFIFAKKGIDLDIDNDEPQAYLMDYIYNEIDKRLTFL